MNGSSSSGPEELVRADMLALPQAIWAAMAQAQDLPAGSAEQLAAWRAAYDDFGDGLPRPAGAIDAVTAGRAAGELVVVEDDAQVVYLHVHGGGFILGSPRSHRGLACHLSAIGRFPVVLPNYGLSPEERAPAAVHDVAAAYQWLLDRGHPPEQIVVGGDSAGAGIALAALLLIRDGPTPLPAGAVLMSPWADHTRPREGSRAVNAADPLYDADFHDMMTSALIGDSGRRSDPMVSPATVELAGLPPLLIQVGSREALRDDAERITDSAARSGGEAVLQVWEGAVHNFQVFPGFFPDGHDSRRAVAAVADFVTKCSTRTEH